MTTMTPEEYTRERPKDLLRYIQPKAAVRAARALERRLKADISAGSGGKHKSAAGYQAANSKVALQWRQVMKAMNKCGRGGGL